MTFRKTTLSLNPPPYNGNPIRQRTPILLLLLEDFAADEQQRDGARFCVEAATWPSTARRVRNAETAYAYWSTVDGT